jgi:hypothetical protein
MAQRGDILADNSEVSVSVRSNTHAGCRTVKSGGLGLAG